MQKLNQDAVPQDPEKKGTQLVGDCTILALFLKQFRRHLRRSMPEFVHIAPDDLAEDSDPGSVLGVVNDDLQSLPDANTKKMLALVVKCMLQAGKSEWNMRGLFWSFGFVLWPGVARRTLHHSKSIISMDDLATAGPGEYGISLLSYALSNAPAQAETRTLEELEQGFGLLYAMQSLWSLSVAFDRKLHDQKVWNCLQKLGEYSAKKNLSWVKKELSVCSPRVLHIYVRTRGRAANTGRFRPQYAIQAAALARQYSESIWPDKAFYKHVSACFASKNIEFRKHLFQELVTIVIADDYLALLEFMATVRSVRVCVSSEFLETLMAVLPGKSFTVRGAMGTAAGARHSGRAPDGRAGTICAWDWKAGRGGEYGAAGGQCDQDGGW